LLGRLRSHVRQQFVGYVALFVALGGTAAAAGYVVSNNGQLGPKTVSGSAPPSGKHDNVIPGSLTGLDIKRNSIGGKQILEASLGKVPSAASADTLGGQRLVGTGVVRLPVGHAGTDSRTLLKTPWFEVDAKCDYDPTGGPRGGPDATARITIKSLAGPAYYVGSITCLESVSGVGG
jgi:hypothetical protein